MINNMKKKEYQRPTVDVVELKQQQHLLAGSTGGAGVQDFNWNTVPEESRGMDEFLETDDFLIDE